MTGTRAKREPDGPLKVQDDIPAVGQDVEKGLGKKDEAGSVHDDVQQVVDSKTG